MQKGPLKALLAVLAVAGFQNRDKIADMLREATRGGASPADTSPTGTSPTGTSPTGTSPTGTSQTGTSPVGTSPEARSDGTAQSGTASPSSSGGLDDLLGSLQGGLGGILAGGSLGSVLNSGLGELLDQFRQTGKAGKADSWVQPGDNEPIDDSELAEALGDDVLADLTARTGLSREEILSRLSKDLPGVVDELTPEGKLPASGPFA